MAAEDRCPSCGAVNPPGTSFCGNCGRSLAANATGTDWERARGTDLTEMGLPLILIGTLASAITLFPFVWLPGWLLSLSGAVLVVLGRKAFGVAHARNVFISIVLSVLAILIATAGSFVAVALTIATFGRVVTPASLQAAFHAVLDMVFASGIVERSSGVLFTFALQDQRGKRLLLRAFAVNVVTWVAILIAADGAVPGLVERACLGGTCGREAAIQAIASFQSLLATLGLLGAFSAVLLARAYYRAWDRIRKGKIPSPAALPGMMPQPLEPFQPR